MYLFECLLRKHIDIPVQGIQMAGTDGTAQAVNALAQVYRIAAHYKTVVLTQISDSYVTYLCRAYKKRGYINYVVPPSLYSLNRIVLIIQQTFQQFLQLVPLQKLLLQFL